MLDLFRRARWIVLFLLAVYLASFGAGYEAGKLRIVDLGKMRASFVYEINRNLDYCLTSAEFGQGLLSLKLRFPIKKQARRNECPGNGVRVRKAYFDYHTMDPAARRLCLSHGTDPVAVLGKFRLLVFGR